MTAPESTCELDAYEERLLGLVDQIDGFNPETKMAISVRQVIASVLNHAHALGESAEIDDNHVSGYDRILKRLGELGNMIIDGIARSSNPR